MDYDDLYLCVGTISGAGFRELVEAAAAGGYRGISIWPQHYKGAREQGLSDLDMKLMLEDHDLIIYELDPLVTWLPSPKSPSGAEPSEYEAMFDGEDFFYHIADVLGAGHLNANQAVGESIPEIDLVAEAFAGVCDRAAPHDLKVSLEFLPWSGIPDMETALRIVRQAGCPNCGIVLDMWHHFRSGGSVDDLLALSGKDIVAIHTSDAAAQPEEDILNETMHGRRLPGDGVIDLVGVFRALDTIDCQAPIGVEVISDEMNGLSPLEAAVKAADATRGVLAKSRA
ncbi:MAG: sugar phosphate isomerase/epimerase [Deltaproteobacteria bacterium]|nr:sugar phosphate isomerase/epimerase [Deltaproteobacteria bacterium]